MTDIRITNADLTPGGRLKQQYPNTDGDFNCTDTKITSLAGSPLRVGDTCYCSNTPIASFHGIGKDYLQEVSQYLFLNNCTNLKSQLLGIMLIKKLKGISFNSNKEVENIFNKHLKGDRDLLDCKEELMNKGFKEFAKL